VSISSLPKPLRNLSLYQKTGLLKHTSIFSLKSFKQTIPGQNNHLFVWLVLVTMVGLGTCLFHAPCVYAQTRVSIGSVKGKKSRRLRRHLRSQLKKHGYLPSRRSSKAIHITFLNRHKVRFTYGKLRRVYALSKRRQRASLRARSVIVYLALFCEMQPALRAQKKLRIARKNQIRKRTRKRRKRRRRRRRRRRHVRKRPKPMRKAMYTHKPPNWIELSLAGSWNIAGTSGTPVGGTLGLHFGKSRFYLHLATSIFGVMHDEADALLFRQGIFVGALIPLRSRLFLAMEIGTLLEYYSVTIDENAVSRVRWGFSTATELQFQLNRVVSLFLRVGGHYFPQTPSFPLRNHAKFTLGKWQLTSSFGVYFHL